VGKWARSKRNAKSDIFSLGCIFYEILATLELGQIPILTDNYHTVAGELRTNLENAIFDDLDLKLLATCCSLMIQDRKEDRIELTDLISRLAVKDKLFCDNCKTESKRASW
jgi:serine/threonine protein kinase